MPRNESSSSLKGQTAVVALIVIIIAVLVVIVVFPNILGGGGFNFFGGSGPLTGVGAGTAGVVISSFVASPPSVQGGDDASFTMVVQNKGGIDAESIQYDIFGLSDSASWSGKNNDQPGADTLRRADTNIQFEGEKTTQQWSSTSKEKNNDITYPITGRVTYGYRTESTLSMHLFGVDNAKIKGTSVSQSSVNQIVTTLGPISVKPLGTIPLIGKNTKTFVLSFDISNVGGGRPYINTPSGNNLDKVSITADGCTLTGSSSDLKLIDGHNSIACKITPPSDCSSDCDQNKDVTIKVKYKYVVESTASVKVLKSFEQQQ